MKIYKNDILVLEFDKFGILKKKELYDLEDMNEIKMLKKLLKISIKIILFYTILCLV
jgi:hypothetical protein